MTVVDLESLRNARRVAEIIDRAFGSELRRAERYGCKLMVRLEEEEQVGRGTIGVARVRLVPLTNNARVRMRRAGVHATGTPSESIEGRCDFPDPSDTDSAIKTAIDQAFTFATDNGVF